MKKTEETEKRIVDAAFRLMKAEGFEAASIKQICSDAGVAYSTFYYYFPTKESIVPKFYSRAMLITQEDFARILSVSGAWNRLWAAHTVYIDKIFDIGPEICAQLNRSLLANPETEGSMEVAHHGQVLEPLIKQAQEAGEILHKDDSMDLYKSSVYFVRGIYFIWSMFSKEFDLHQEMRKNFEVFYQVRQDLRSPQ